MTLLINSKAALIENDPWQRVPENKENEENKENKENKNITSDHSIISADTWLNYSVEKRASLLQQFPNMGLELNPELPADELVAKLGNEEELHKISLLQLNIPNVKDGRCYSLAARLRAQYKYQGEIRAIGDYLIDQIYFLLRCGFNTFVIQDESPSDLEDLAKTISPFSEVYQKSTDKSTTVIEKRLLPQTEKVS